MKYLLIIGLLFITITSRAQQTVYKSSAPAVKPTPEAKANIINPQYPGGDEALRKFMQLHLNYPETARAKNLQGTVYLSFIISDQGAISDIKITKDIGEGCGAEAVRIIKLMPKWIPAKQDGKTVTVQYNLPVNFKVN